MHPPEVGSQTRNVDQRCLRPEHDSAVRLSYLQVEALAGYNIGPVTAKPEALSGLVPLKFKFNNKGPWIRG